MPYTDSVAMTTTLPLSGVWLHDPANEETTARGFLYGKAQRADSFDTMGAATFYVGRTSPVVEFGEFDTQTVDATLDIVYGETYVEDLARIRAFAESKIALWFRDNRGRAIYGWISSFKANDQEWGTSVSISFTESHRDVVEVAA